MRISFIGDGEIIASGGAHPGAAGYALIAGLVEGWAAWRRWFAAA